MSDAALIATPTELDALAAHLASCDVIAVDTEFFWERTFYPILGLVQIAASDGCWLIDTVCIRDLGCLGPVLSSPTVVKILHDAPQDLGILARATGAMPRAIFDTRLAAGFAGLASTLSLQALLRETLAVDLPKAETRSDWLRRPLSESQLRYAADDVLHLPALRNALLARCTNGTVREWLREELAQLDDPERYRDRDPRLMYQRVKGTARLTPRQRAVLRELAAWREEEARARDWPRAHVLSDGLLTDLAALAQATPEALAAQPDFPRRMPPDSVASLLAAWHRGATVPEADYPAAAAFDLAAKRALKADADRLLAKIAAACAPYGIDSALVASRADAEAYASLQAAGQDTCHHPLRQGWRSRLLAETT